MHSLTVYLQEHFIQRRLGIINPLLDEFYLDHASNLSYRKFECRLTWIFLTIDYLWCCVVDPSIHVSLDLYALIALTASSSTLNELINVVRADNDRRQQEADASGVLRPRNLDVSIPSFNHRGHVFTAGSLHCPVSPTQNLNSSHYTPNIISLGVPPSLSVIPIPQYTTANNMLWPGTDVFASRAILAALAYPHSVVI